MPEISVNAVRLAVEDIGDGPAVLFLHGFPHDGSLWHHQVAGLMGVRRVAPDLRGFGRSEVSPSPPGMSGYAADLRQLVDRLVLDRVVLCGLSMGGYIAFECCRLWPEKIAGLILVDTRAEPDSDDARSARDATIAEVRSGGMEAVVEGMVLKQLGKTTVDQQPEVVSQVRQMMLHAPVQGVIGALEAMKQRPDSRPLLPALGRIPVLVLVGEEDLVTPPDAARAMADAIPGAELELIPEAGHLAPLEQPERVTERLQQFLSFRT
jgi:pimeloyl-ACP methyl ester carboxylesterase